MTQIAPAVNRMPSSVSPLTQIGVLGGHTLVVLGARSDVHGFFEAASQATPWSDPDIAHVLLDRLYRRYVADTDLTTLEAALQHVAAHHRSHARMAAFIAAAGHAAAAFGQEFGPSQPVRLVRATMPAFMVDKMRPLPAYDALTGDPLWM